MNNLINEVVEIVSYGMIEGSEFTYAEAIEDATLLIENVTPEILKTQESEIKKQAMKEVVKFVETECEAKEGYEILVNAAYELMTENKASELLETYTKRVDGMLIEYKL